MTISYAGYASDVIATLATKADAKDATDTHKGTVAECCTALYTLATKEIATLAETMIEAGDIGHASEMDADTISRAIGRVGNVAGATVADAAAKRSDDVRKTLASTVRSNTTRIRTVLLAAIAGDLLVFGTGAKRVTFNHNSLLAGASVDKCYRSIVKAEKVAEDAAQAAFDRKFAGEMVAPTADIATLSDDAFMAEYLRRMNAAREADAVAQAA